MIEILEEQFKAYKLYFDVHCEVFGGNPDVTFFDMFNLHKW